MIDQATLPEQPIMPTNVVPVAAAPVNGANVRKWLLDYVHSAQKRAESASQTDLWNAVEAAENAYGANERSITPQEFGIRAASVDSEYDVKTFDLADQVDEMIALLNNLLKSGPIRRFVAKPGITDEQAELTAKVQDSMLAEKDFDAALRVFAGRYVKHKLSGLKVVRSREVTYVTEQVEVPIFDPMTGEDYSDSALMQMGFSPEDIEDGSAITRLMGDKGLTFVGIADMDENGYFSKFLCTKCKEVPRDYVYIAPINAAKIAVEDLTRPLSDQPSVHEYDYYTLNDLRKGYYPNIEALKEKGREIKSTKQQTPGNKTMASSIGDGRLDQPVFQVVRSWMEIPWQDAMENRKFTDAELIAFAQEEGFPYLETNYASQKWCVFHNDGDVFLKMHPNYLLDKSESPYEGGSYVYADGCDGQGMMERLSNVAANLLACLNLAVGAVKMSLYNPMIVSDRCEMTADDFKKLRRPGGFHSVPGQVQAGVDFQWYSPPDSSQAAMNMVAYFENKLRSLGVPAILAGEGNAETATQDSINNQRGQTVVNEAFARMMNIIIKTMRKHLGCMVNSFTTARYIEIVGESGATMTRRWTQPKEITDKLEIIPLISFEDANRQRMAQFLISTMNVFAMILAPPEVKEMFWIVLRKGGVEESDIEKIKGSLGSATNVYQEIQSMLQDPELHPEVRMDDPHPICIQFAQKAMQDEMALAQQQAREPKNMSNVQEYIQTHEGMLQQQQMMEMQQAMLMNEPPPKGKPAQARKDGGPGTEEGAARQTGQAVGEGNKGMQSAAGITGVAAPSLVPGSPAGV